MHIERIYIQDNFVPDIVSDQFRRKVIGVSICLKEGEGTRDAEEFAEEYIAEYIKKNTVNPFVSGVSIVADNAVVPIVDIKADEPPPTKLTKEEQQKKYLTDCTTIDELKSFKLLVKNNPHLQETFDNHLNKLTNGL